MTQPFGQRPPAPPASYGAPQYGAYGPPPGRPRFGAAAGTLAVIGGIAVAVGFFALNWFDGGSDSKFTDIRDVVTDSRRAGEVPGLVKVYYGWLGFVLLAAVVIAALLAAAPRTAAPFRVIGVVVALAAAAVTFVAIKITSASAPGYSDYLKHARFGFYFAVGGFLVCGIAALVGPKHD